MKVLNIALNGVYTDGFSYHENLLPKYHKKNGHDVYVIASEYVFSDKGEAVKTQGPREYIDENGVHVYRLPIKNDKDILFKLKQFEGLYPLIEKIAPDIIFCHLFQFLDVLQVIKYKRLHPEVKLYVDSHSDYSNSASNWPSKHILHGILWRYCAQKALPLAERFYGVLPARVAFLKERYHLPEEKVVFLPMGADDERVTEAADPDVCRKIREKYGVAEDDILLVTGGKIDAFKTQTLLLMEAVHNIRNPKVKLLVFGSVAPELQERINALSDGQKVQYIGWIQADDSYGYFAACDLAVFPGRHSVFWEQVAGQGKPLMCKSWDGTHHVDVGGNVVFLYQDSAEEIQTQLENLLENPEAFEKMKKVAREKGKQEFSYTDIARRSLE